MKLDSIANEDYEKQEHISDVMAMVERIVIRERNAFYEAGYAEGIGVNCTNNCDVCKEKCNAWQKGYNYRKGKDLVEVVRCKDCIHATASGYCNIIENTPPENFFCRSGRTEL